MNLFQKEIESEAIERIRKFSVIAASMGFDVSVGFSGGKDSQVVYDLCKRSGIQFTAYFNHAFESQTTLQFIRQYYPDVIWRRDHNFGFIQNIWCNHNSMLPTVEHAYCCEDYKHNPRYLDNASIVGIRREESNTRKKSKTFEVKNKTLLKRNKALFNDYFTDECTGISAKSLILLKPIVDWTEDDVWSYIRIHQLPINAEYITHKRVGCIVCPKANFNSNSYSLLMYPKLIDAFIKARLKNTNYDWIITSDSKDYSDDKPYYICRWLNHSFRPFTKRQYALYKLVRVKYNQLHK